MNKTPDELTSLATAADDDLVVVYDTSASVLKKMEFADFLAQILAGLGSSVLAASNNLSDLANAATARVNLGLGSAAQLASSAVFQVANNLSEVANAATARTNLGAAAAASPVITGGMDFTGAVKQNVQAVAATTLDASVAEVQTKSISGNTTFSLSGTTSGKAMAFILVLTITSSAVPTFTGVRWTGGSSPNPGNGTHIFGFIYDGTNWTGAIGPSNVS